jgi:hypothetical protein
MGKRGPAIDRNEIFHMLELIEEILPIGGAEWDMVESRHRVAFPDKMRNKDTIKKKFNQLKDVKPRTGDPYVPEEVKRSKEIWAKIVEKMQGEDGEDTLGEDDDDDEEENFQSAKDEDEQAEEQGEDFVSDELNSIESGGSKQVAKMQQPLLGARKKKAVFQTPVSRPGTKRPSFNSADDSSDRYLKYLVAEQQLERERSDKQLKLQLPQFQMQQQQQQQQFQQTLMMQQHQQQQFQQMMQFMMMGTMSNNPTFRTTNNYASMPSNIAPEAELTAQEEEQATDEIIQDVSLARTYSRSY